MIARKWRPKTFSELVGQGHVSQTLLNAMKNERLPHAVLFTGPRGTGKTSSARLLAKSLRCTEAKDFVPCNQCKECEDISSGRSFDVIELDGASNNGVDAVRDLQEGVRSMPSSGKFKLYIIDEVHMLSISAFNALLKTLEEPPAHVIFALATTEVQKLPNTILSRCQRFDFRRIPVRQVSEHLKHICESDGVTYDEESLWIIARQGEGSMRDSQSLLDQVITYTNSNLEQSKVIEILGLTDRGLLLDTTNALCHRRSETMLEIIKKIFHGGHDAKVFCEDLLEEIRHLLLVKMNPDRITEIVDLPESEIEHLADLSVSMSEEDIHMLFDMTLKGAGDIARSSDPRLVLEMLLLRMVAAPKVQSLSQLFAGGVNASTNRNKGAKPLPHAKPATKAAPTPTPQPQKTAATSSTSTTPAPAPKKAQPAAAVIPFDIQKSAQENWFLLVSGIKKSNAMLAAKLENTHLVSLEEDELILGLPESLQFLHEQFKSEKFVQELVQLLQKNWQKQLKIQVKVVDPSAQQSDNLSPKQAEKKRADEYHAGVRKQVEGHPLVQSAQRDLNAKIDSISDSNSK